MAKKKGVSKSKAKDDKYLKEYYENKDVSKTPERKGLRIFLIFLLIIGLFIPISAYVETQVTAEPNVRYAVTKMAKDICEMEADNPSVSCRPKELPKTEFSDGYTYQNMIDDVVNFIYYGGGKGTENLSSQQKAFVGVYRLKNFYENSRYAYFLLVLALIGIVSLVALFYRRKDVLLGSLASTLNITLFLLFFWHALMFIFWVGFIPRVLSTIVRSSGDAMRALFFGADFGFSLSKLHLFVAVGALILFIITIIVRRASSKE